jgi:hypothetical protein
VNAQLAARHVRGESVDQSSIFSASTCVSMPCGDPPERREQRLGPTPSFLRTVSTRSFTRWWPEAHDTSMRESGPTSIGWSS